MEIGSEYWLEENTNKVNNINKYLVGEDYKLLLSGRTAIDYILEEISKNKKIQSVYFPNYCCQSMLDPFIKRNINIHFYNIKFENGLKYIIDCNKQCDIFFAMNYFGFNESNMNKYIKNFKKKRTIIIEDMTHNLMNLNMSSLDSDYIVASLRKWFPILSGGIAINKKSKFSKSINLENENEEMIKNKEKAMTLKRQYMKEKNIDKNGYLELYKRSNKNLNENYEKILIDEKSRKILEQIEIQEIINQRKENAKTIYNKLNKKVKILFKELQEENCPLFVPIILENKETRDKLRKYLIENEVYCPVHWPVPEILKDEKSNIYDRELSLICDHRYNTKDIEREINLINQFFN